MNYVFVYYLPGSAGNFFGRCLNLLNNSYCFVNTNNPILLTSLDEKLDLLSYCSVNKKKFDERVWIKFEHQVMHYSKMQPHWDLPKDSYSIWCSHPTGQHDFIPGDSFDMLPGEDDSVYKLYIDSSECFEWGIMNALYKNSYLSVDWFINSNDLKDDKNTYKINLKNIISGKEMFLVEVRQVCDFIKHTLTDNEISALKNLYDQWSVTTLKEIDIPEFKKNIGFLM